MLTFKCGELAPVTRNSSIPEWRRGVHSDGKREKEREKLVGLKLKAFWVFIKL